MSTVLAIITSIILAPIAFLVFIPAMPAIPFMFILTLLYGFIDKFNRLGLEEFLIFGAIVVASLIIDWSAGVLGAKYGGAGRDSLIFGFLGAIVGTFLLPPFGGIIGLFAGVLLAELVQFRSHKKALRAASWSAIGSISGMFINFILALAFLVLFLIFVF
jgi:uncharacterized protein YqgC (DUF456 family)